MIDKLKFYQIFTDSLMKIGNFYIFATSEAKISSHRILCLLLVRFSVTFRIKRPYTNTPVLSERSP